MRLSLGNRANWAIAIVEWRARRIEDPIERLRYLRRANHAGYVTSNRPRVRRHAWKVALLIAGLFAPAPTVFDSAAMVDRPLPLVSPEAHPEVVPNIWLVEDRKDYEIYSNGLRIENRYLAKPEKTPSPVFRRVHGQSLAVVPLDGPAGIVYHTTESLIVPFEEDQNGTLKRLGDNLLHYIRRERSYHFVIDRFGRVFRIVPEDEPANHAGRSVWSDDGWLYVHLNHSFLGVAFEAQTHGDEQSPTAGPAQVHAARILTAMLRAKYKIAASRCVTHAQVSVNPDNWRIGYHTDWAGNFPFVDIGLPDNYDIPPAALQEFGFGYDPAFIHSTGARMWKGVALAEDQVRQQASAAGAPVARYRKELQRKYRDLSAAFAGDASGEETNRNVAAQRKE
jgi:N-acetylmuramoyl-L-alanine amidase-like protein